MCERCGRAKIEHLHHRLFRSRGGDLIEDAVNIAGLCGRCHAEVHRSYEWPWVVPGRVLPDKLTGRPVYTGPDEEYAARYPAAA